MAIFFEVKDGSFIRTKGRTLLPRTLRPPEPEKYTAKITITSATCRLSSIMAKLFQSITSTLKIIKISIERHDTSRAAGGLECAMTSVVDKNCFSTLPCSGASASKSFYVRKIGSVIDEQGNVTFLESK